MEKLKVTIIQFGDQKNITALQKLIENIDSQELTSLLQHYICLPVGLTLLNYLLIGFNDSNESHTKRFRLTDFILKLLEENNVSSSQTNNVILRLRTEFPKFKSNHLIPICDNCIERIQKGNVSCTNWKNILPEILTILVTRDCITYNSVEMTGIDFKNKIINSLCTINWSPNIVTPLASIFRDIPLTKEEHFQVVNKLGQTMEKLTGQEIPAFTYQLLKLCSKQNGHLVFLKLQQYFSVKIYKNLGQDLEPSSSLDLDDISPASEKDIVHIESTVLYHIHDMGIFCSGIVKEYLNSIKNMMRAPEFILHPFQLTVLLVISTIPNFEEQTLDIVRSSIVRVVHEDLKKAESAWLRSNISVCTKTSNIISAVLENSIRERSLVSSGLINLSFVLLNAGVALGAKNIAEAQWQLGTFILLKLMKRKYEVSSSIIQQLCNRIVVGQNVPQLTDCLYQMCRSLSLNMLENQGIIKQLIEQILQFPGSSSRFIIDAVMPLVKLSSTIRDNLIILLRKALYSRNVEISQMAVSGYLNLLKIFRISNLDAMSQMNSSTSNFSFLTQISLEHNVQKSSNQFNNEALCLEVIEILRRCFMQQAEVKQELYEGLFDAVCKNLELGIPALDMLWIHFSQFYNEDEDILPPLKFSKIFVTRNVEVILQEPLGQLIFVTGLIATKVIDSHDESNQNVTQITTILESLCNRMAKCELIHFDLDTGRDLLDNLPECQADLLTLKQAMSVCEALIGYLICSWRTESENVAQKINSLFQVYSRLVDLSKNLNRPKKGDERKKAKDDTKNKSTALKTKVFKPTLTVLNFQTVGKILSLLHEPTVIWTSTAQANILKVKFEFHRYIFNVILQLVQNIKSTKCIETIHTKPYFSFCTEIAAILYDKIIKRLSNFLDFDATSAVLAVECFLAILNLVSSYYKDNLIDFLTKVGSQSKDLDLGEHLLPIIEIFQKFFEQDDEYADDAEGKKLPVLMVNIYTILVTNLPNDSPEIAKVLDWLKKFTNEKTVPNKQMGTAIISLLLNLNIRCKKESNLYENIAIRICDVAGTIKDDKPDCPVQLKIINEGTALMTLTSLTNSLKLMLNEIDWMIQRCKAEYCLIIQPGGERIERRKELLKNKERDICCHVCRIVNVCTLLSNISVPSGSNTETIFKVLIQLYNTLNSLTKYFLLISSKINPAFQSARFESVLKLAGKPLLSMVDSFILYIEQESEVDEDSTQKKKSSNTNTMKTKILRETRLIPKLVYEMEQFGRNVITLSNKTKIDLSKYVGLGTSRDFRIKAPALKEALEQIPEGLDESRTTIDDDETTENLNGINDSNEEEESNKDNESPPKKKSRKSK